jgi:N-acetylmuramoyl-L-alanine amidase
VIITQTFLPKPSPCRPGLILSKPTSITIHWIGPYPNQTVDIPYNWWLKSGLQASAHYIVKDLKVLQCVPENEVAWHCGSKGNYTSLGIEVIPMNIAGQFSADTIDTLCQLLQGLPKVELLRHYDWTGKNCPLYYTPLSDGGQERWEALVKELNDGRK